MKIEKYTLMIHDKRLERKFLFSRKKKTIKFSRFFYLLLLFLASIYIVLAVIIEPIEYTLYYKITPIISGYIAFVFTFTEFYSTIYNRAILTVFAIITFIKIILDWVYVSEIIALFSALISIVSSCTANLNVNIVPIYFFNIINFISFLIRF